jgi:hypothetical protein
MFFGYW